jgi:hypothetical protein
MSIAVVVLSVPVLLVSGTMAAGAASASGQHRVVTRPGVPETTPGKRVVSAPTDARARVRAAAAAATTGSTSYSYTSAAGDYIGQGVSRTYTAPGDTVSVRGDRGHVSVYAQDATGSSWWSVDLSAGAGDTLHPGTFVDAERDPFRTGRAPGLDASGEGRGCNEVYGRFTVNQIAFDTAGALSMADITFVQRCESESAPAYTGTIHLNQFPLSYRQVSDAGDYVGGGGSKTYLNSTSLITVSGGATGFSLDVSGQRDWWNGSFSAPTGTTLTVGKTYPAARFSDATHAGVDLGGDGRGCNSVTGSLTIQALELDAAGRIAHLRAVFEQHCEGGTPALRGTLRYFA